MTADRPCSDVHLAKIAMLITDWREVSPFLGLTEADEIAILESTHSVSARKMAMLRKWKQKFGGRGTTYNRLCQVFRDCDLIDLEEKVMEMVTESYTTDNTSSVSAQASVNRPSRSAVPIGIHYFCPCI